MIKRKHIVASSLLLSGFMLATTANAKQIFQDNQPVSYGGAISCSTCHSGAPTENNVTTSYGVAYNQRVNDDVISSITSTYNTLEPFDSDGDGFSNIQEILAKSNVNISASTPLLTAPNLIATTGDISAKAVTGGPVSALSLQSGTPATALGGIVSFTSPYYSVAPYLTTAQFMFKAGGAQAGATATFYNADGTVNNSNITGQNSFIPNIDNGSVDVGITDEGVFDLYSTTVFQKAAVARTPTFTPVPSPELINPYAQVDPYAVISPLATIDDYAVVDAYAIVDDYATIGVYAQVGSYAYIAPNVDLYAGIDIYTHVVVDAYASVDAYATVASPAIIKAKSGVGVVEGKFSITTTPPAKLLLGTAGGTGVAGTTGGLHCMSTGLGTQGLMFLGLLGTAFLVRRKLS